MTPRYELPEGTEVAVVVTGVIRRVSNAHGLCYIVEFPQKDYMQPRTVWLDDEEVVPIDDLPE